MCVRRASQFSSRGLLDGSSNSCTLPAAQGDHLRIFIELRGYGAKGPRYRVRKNAPDGIVIIESTTEPLYDAARFLLAKGITGKVEMWDRVRAFPRMGGDIERLATMTVSDGQHGIALRKYVELSVGGDLDGNAPQGAQNKVGRPKSVMRASSPRRSDG